MNISEVARSAGLSASGVRWYERAGVLPPARRDSNGYRAYSDQDRRLLQFISTLRRLGVPPAEAGALALRFVAGDILTAEVAAILGVRRAEINHQQAALTRLIDELDDLQETFASTTNLDRSRGTAEPIGVLFLCNANSGRSQMGEALLRQIGGAACAVCSAGLLPEPVSVYAVRALQEQGIDWGMARSKDVTKFRDRCFDYVITLSERARDSCPRLPGPHNTLHWNLPDPGATSRPDEQQLEAYRQTITALRQRLLPFIELALMARTDARKGI